MAARVGLSQLMKRLAVRGNVQNITIPQKKPGAGRVVRIRRSNDLRDENVWLEEKTTVIKSSLAALDAESQKPGVYCGFDPTSDSLHIGHLTVLYTMLRFAQNGYPVISLIGGATGQLGDPAGKLKKRKKTPQEVILRNAESLKSQIEHIIKRFELRYPETKDMFSVMNNESWYKNLTLREYINDVAAHFKLPNMLSRQVVQKRIKSDNMFLPEFSYMTFQAYDWYQLYTQHNCRLQLGGVDQIGNIEDGFCYIWMRQPSNQRCNFAGITTPLVVGKSGQKIGKSSGNAFSLRHGLESLRQIEEFLDNNEIDALQRFASVLTQHDMNDLQVMEESRLMEIILEELGFLLDGSYSIS